MQLEEILKNSGHKYRKEILAMPIIALAAVLAHMTVRKGVRGDETVGEYASGAEMRPYKTAKGATDTGSFKGRTLTTYLGDVVEEFDPYQLFATVYGESFSSLTDRKEADIVRDMALAMAKTVSGKLGKAVFKAVRDKDGSTTMDLFNGFDTIAAQEIADGGISKAKGNLYEYSGDITAENAGDVLKQIAAAAVDELTDQENVKMFVPKRVKDMYEEWCLSTLGAVSYNTSFDKKKLHGTDIELVALSGQKSSDYIYLTTKKNMLVGMDQQSDAEKVKIRECDNPKAVQFFMCMYFGVQFESLSPEVLLVAQKAAASADAPSSPSDGEGDGAQGGGDAQA